MTERTFEPGPPPPKAPPTSDPRESYDDRLARILEVATHVIARDGYEKASMRALAEASGVSLAGLYHYLDGKEKMLFLIQFRTFNSILANLRERLLGVDDPVEQLCITVRSHVAYFAANMAALKVCSHELDSLSGDAYEQLRRIRREYYELVRDMVQRIIKNNGSASKIDHHVATMSLFGTLNWLYRWYDPQASVPPTRLANQITAQFLGGLGGAPSVASSSSQRTSRQRAAGRAATSGHTTA